MAQRIAHRLAFSLCLLAVFPASARPQSRTSGPRADNQIWSDVQAAHALRESTDLLLSGSVRLGREASHPVYERLARASPSG